MLTPKYTGERGTVVSVLMIEVGGGRVIPQVWVDLDDRSIDRYGRGRCRDEGRDYPGVPWNDDSVRACALRRGHPR